MRRANEVDETICLAAIMQALIAKLYKLRQQNLSFRPYPRYLVSENKWRAARYGIGSNLIDFGKEKEVTYRALADELLDFIKETAEELGSLNEVNYVYEILKNGTGADRQIKIYEETKDFNAVVDYIVNETKFGL